MSAHDNRNGFVLHRIQGWLLADAPSVSRLRANDDSKCECFDKIGAET
jgi:hypothetical protein